MNSPHLHSLVRLRAALSDVIYDSGELSGILKIDATLITDLITMAAISVTEDSVTIGENSEQITTLKFDRAQVYETAITFYTRSLDDGLYYDNPEELITAHPYRLPGKAYYIASLDYFSEDAVVPEIIMHYQNVIKLIALLSEVADYIKEAPGERDTLIYFEKSKLHLQLIYGKDDLRKIDFIDKLREQLFDAHDFTERRSIFRAELISYLKDTPTSGAFAKLLAMLNEVYEHYKKSHLLYLEKFSYQDLKSEVDKDQLDYMKKIYASVNDIQSKVIAVPAAFILIYTQFDFTGAQFLKNILLLTGAVLFSVLIEVLLRNQFGVLAYIEEEIEQLKTILKNKDTQLDLTEFLGSYGKLAPLINKQRNYLILFRIVTWLVPGATFLFLMIYSK
ncbi:hypothetical protein ACFFGT_04175 [Mucilaginibacter angelicae]|uniref:Uncharacterized protein n=1 Tax=Mucilaginibacter angelicae TaxID=869718 RepID=A0ABV6L0Y0_9SPHI